MFKMKALSCTLRTLLKLTMKILYIKKFGNVHDDDNHILEED
jgi:hypothetical protein